MALAIQPHPDPVVQQKLEWFQDQKLGLLMHWGTYSQWGVVESWSICPEDEDWTKRRGPHAGSYTEYLRAYEDLKSTFNPLKFDPAAWADAARGAGMRYVVFTTKHHDGFCLFDTQLTDYKVTYPGCPFSQDPRANVAKEVFAAFRREGLGTGAYFSKADWHCPDYWWPYFPPFDRNVNYDITRYPAKWEAFKRFTRGQIQELMRDYGPMDILWLDVNGAAIYGTRAVAPYKEDRLCYTRSPQGTISAILLASAEESGRPASLLIPSFAPRPGQSVRLLGVDEPLRWEPAGTGCRVFVPESVRATPPCRHAWAFQLAVG